MSGWKKAIGLGLPRGVERVSSKAKKKVMMPNNNDWRRENIK